METVTKEKEAKLENELAVKFITLISKFAATYDSSIKEWQSYPNVDDIIVKENQQQYIKKISITLKVLLRKAEKNNEIHIQRVLKFTLGLLDLPDLFTNLTKLNLLVNNGITLLQLNNCKEKTEENLKQIMLLYLTNVIRNFNCSYQNTFASLLSIIANNLSIYNGTTMFFDYEQFFLGEDAFVNQKLVPKIIEETNKLNKTLGDDTFVQDFELDTIVYENDLDLLYYMNALFEFKDLKKYKNTYSKEEYDSYKEKIRQKVFEERKQKNLENEENQKKNKEK